MSDSANSEIKNQSTKIKRKPVKIITVDKDVTKLLIKQSLQFVEVEDELSHKGYKVVRTTGSGGLQMTGN